MKTSLLTFLACLVFSLTARAEFYFFSDLGTFASYTFVKATGINNKGEVVGTIDEAIGRPVAFRHAAGKFLISPSPGPSHSTWGNAINAAGTIVGLCDRTGHPMGSVYHAFYANPGASAVDLDNHFNRDSEAKAINDSGYVVGSIDGQSFLGHTAGWMMPLDLGNNFSARSLNNSLVIIGNGTFGGLAYDFISKTSTYFGFPLGNWDNRAGAINVAGVVAGRVGTQGFLYSAGMVKLFGANIAEVKAINSRNDVVGTTKAERAFVYLHSSGHFLDLNTVVSAAVKAKWTLIEATGINDSGVICGQARRLATPADGPGYGLYVYRAFKLTPGNVLINPLPLTLE